MRIILTVLLVVGLANQAAAQEVAVVVPNGLENREGNAATPPLGSPFRIQRLYEASEFASLPDMHRFMPPTQFIFVPGHLADYDTDGNVDVNDFAIWQTSFDHTDGGDTDGDGDTDGNDFLTWQQEFGQSVTAAAAPMAVPEPSTLLLATFGLVVLGGSYRRR